MANIKQINIDLLNACIADNVDLSRIEKLLKQGAQPLGCVEDYGLNNLYDVVLYHYLDMAKFGEGDDSVFLNITELFLKYGMDISKPEVPYDEEHVINPLWSFAFYDTETAFKTLKLLLDNGLDVESAGECWSHQLLDWSIMEFPLDEERHYQTFFKVLKKIMLFASYPHIILNDECLQKEIWFSENNYNYTKFRNWNSFSYVIDTKYCKDFPQADGSIITIVENESGEKVWKFGFGISKEEYVNKTLQ